VERWAQHSVGVVRSDMRDTCSVWCRQRSRGSVVTCLQSSKEIKDREVLIVGGVTIEVTVCMLRHVVNLDEKTCSYKAWQVTRQPCNYTLLTIAKLSREFHMEDFVHEYYFTGSERHILVFSIQWNPSISGHVFI
jgi:hypothetical protein